MPLSRREFLRTSAAVGAAVADAVVLPAPAGAAVRAPGAATATRFGIDVTTVGWPSGTTRAQAYQKDLAAFGAGFDSHCESFSSSGFDSALNSMKAMYGGLHPGAYPLICAKSYTAAGFKACLDYFGGLGVPWVAVFWHEPQDDILAGKLTSATYRSTVQAMAKQAASDPHGALLQICVTHSGHSLFAEASQCKAKGCDAVSLAQGLPIAFMAMDLYLRQGSLSTYLNQMDTFAGWAQQVGKPYALTEFGIGSAYPSQASAVQAAVSKARSAGYSWANYWWGGGQADYRSTGAQSVLKAVV